MVEQLQRIFLEKSLLICLIIMESLGRTKVQKIFIIYITMILEILVASVFIATIFNIVLHKFNMPTIIGYILT